MPWHSLKSMEQRDWHRKKEIHLTKAKITSTSTNRGMLCLIFKRCRWSERHCRERLGCGRNVPLAAPHLDQLHAQHSSTTTINRRHGASVVTLFDGSNYIPTAN